MNNCTIRHEQYGKIFLVSYMGIVKWVVWDVLTLFLLYLVLGQLVNTEICFLP